MGPYTAIIAASARCGASPSTSARASTPESAGTTNAKYAGRWLEIVPAAAAVMPPTANGTTSAAIVLPLPKNANPATPHTTPEQAEPTTKRRAQVALSAAG